MSGVLLLILRLILALSLYAFLGWAFLTLWRELKQQGEALDSKRMPVLNLQQDLAQGGGVHRFVLPKIIVGRDPHCELHLEDKTVSGDHACLSYHDGQWWVEDLHSTNGTYLNQEFVTSPVVLASGDELHFGQLAFKVEIGDSKS